MITLQILEGEHELVIHLTVAARFVSIRNLHAREWQLMKKYSDSSIFDFTDFNIIITDVSLSVTKVFIREAKRLSKYEDGVV